MAASRIIAPKMASLMGSTAVKAARPMMRSSIKAQVPSQRAFSGKLHLHLHILQLLLPKLIKC